MRYKYDNINKESWSFLSLFLLEMKEMPEISSMRQYGKELHYSRSFRDNMRFHLLSFLRFLGPLDIREITRDHVYGFNSNVLQRPWASNRHGAILISCRQFLRWLKRKEIILNDFNDVWVIPPELQARQRRYPQVSIDTLTKIRDYKFRGESAIRDTAAVALIYNGFRTSEISWFRWEYFPVQYFKEYNVEYYLSNVKRKGGTLWNGRLDEHGWGAMRDLWKSQECPAIGICFTGQAERWKSAPLLACNIAKIFKIARDSILYMPEDKETRKLITPHFIRHIWAQQTAENNPQLGSEVCAAMGGWLPGSLVYLRRYRRVRDRFVINIARSAKDGSLKDPWGAK